MVWLLISSTEKPAILLKRYQLVFYVEQFRLELAALQKTWQDCARQRIFSLHLYATR